MFLGYVAIGTVTGACAGLYAFLDWEVSVWLALAIYAGIGNLGLLGAVAVTLAVEALRRGGSRAQAEPHADTPEIHA